METLNKLWKQGQDFLNCEYPIMGGAMSWISESNLVSNISNSGGFGVLASSSMNKEELKKEIHETKAKTNKAFGVNLILLNSHFQDLVDLCIEEQIPHVVLAGGVPSSFVIKKLKQGNCKVMVFAPNLLIAKRFIKDGVDALVLEGSEAGGHIGPVSTTVLVQEVLPYIKEVPIFVAGGIGHGEMMASFLEMGAAGVQIGTLFVCSEECIAHDNFKKAFIKAKARHAQPTVQISSEFPVIPVRSISNKGTVEFMHLQQSVIEEYKDNIITKEEATFKIENYWAGALKRAVIEGDIEYGSLMAGQTVGMIDGINSVNSIIQNLVSQANNYFNIRRI